ncbi:unnamed protein product [Rotaria socialis]|uniref:long-chain-fatty-acid--CoA ligase n=1 Tax=Rotaria socialis TaxID=392032 RepID=A0A820WGZ3_9BILA|nr:unnamed protein product [Rotaria socialis]
MDPIVSDKNLSSSFQTTLAVGGAVALIAGAVIHRHKDKLSSFLAENLVNDEMNLDIDWQKLSIPAQAQGCPEARVAADLGLRPLITKGKSTIDDRVFSTFYEGFKVGRDTANRRGDKRCLGFRVDRQSEYQWVTYDETERAATEIGSGLIQVGEHHGQKTFIGIYASNSVEWMTTAIACHFHSMIYVPLYDTLGEAAIVHIINQTSLKTIFVDKPENILNLLGLADQVSTLKRIILTKKLPAEKEAEIRKKAEEKGIAIMTYIQLLEIGRSEPVLHHPPKPDDIFEICYTSGTTGLPKGAMLTHKNIISLSQSANEFFYDNIQATTRRLGPIKRCLFNMALSAKARDVEEHRVSRHMVWDGLVLKPIQQRLGGRVKLIVSGAAPLSPTILQFLKRVCGAYVVEGYGQTECCGVAACQPLGDATVGNIGVPLSCNMIKLVDVPEMQYFAKDNVGELCIQGANVFKGYYKDEEKTREALDADGWLHTGDVAKWTPSGRIQIIDRKKHMFKLSQGEYVAPERIENIYIQSKYVAQVFVYGNGYKSYTVAIIVPDSDELEKHARAEHISGDMAALCKKKEIKDLIFNDIKNLEKFNGLKGFEMAKDVYLFPEQFSVENNLLTPTMKTKRSELSKYFEKEIDEMYKDIE